MDTSIVLTVVIRGPAYFSLVEELAAIADGRERAGMLKRLAEDGARAAYGELPISRPRSPGAALKPEGEAGHLDIRLVIRMEEFPRLHSALAVEENARARASLLRRLAAEALCPRPNDYRLSSPQDGLPRTTTRSANTGETSLASLGLPPDALPMDLLAGFGVR